MRLCLPVGSRKRATTSSPLVRVVLTVVAAAGMAVAASVVGVESVAAAPSPAPNPADFSCIVPPLPKGVTGTPGRTATLSGPAVSALRGGAALHGFSLDGGDFVVKLPRRDQVPVLSANQAVCGAMASTGDLSASATEGVAVGYGQVSVADKFLPAISGLPGSADGASKYPTVASFHDRLAWIVVVHTNPAAFSCPAMRSPVHLVRRATDYGYKVFVIDARTGTDALIYTEGGPGGAPTELGCRPPSEWPKNPFPCRGLWSRATGGYSGTIAATVLPCDQTPSVVLVDRAGPNVVVEVTRPFGPPCGPPQTVSINLHAAVVTADLPATIGHDPVGLTNLLSFHPPGAPTATTTTTTVPTLVPLDASSNGHTVDLVVGQVVTVQPLPGSQGFSFTNPAVSSDPTVLGPLTSSPQPVVAEIPGVARRIGRDRRASERLHSSGLGSTLV